MSNAPPWQIVTGIGGAVMMLGTLAGFGFNYLHTQHDMTLAMLERDIADLRKMVDKNTERSKKSEARWLEQDILFPDAYRDARQRFVEERGSQ